MPLKLEIVEEQEQEQALSKGQQKKAQKRAAAAVEEKSKAAAPEPTSMEEQIKALISAIKRKIEEISIMIGEKQSIDDAYTQQLDELINKQQSNQQELDVLKEQLSLEKKKLSKNEQILKLLNGESENDSVGGADIVQPSTAKSAKQVPSSAPEAPTLAQKVAAAAALPMPALTKPPSVAPVPKGKEAASSSAVQLVKIESFQTVKGSKTFENPFVTTLISIAKLLGMKDTEPVCPATFANTLALEMIEFFATIENCPLRIMFCERKGCEHAKHFGNHKIFISKTIQQLKTNPTETLQVFESVVEHLSIAGINGMFEGKKFVYDENMRDFAFHISAEYYQAIQ